MKNSQIYLKNSKGLSWVSDKDKQIFVKGFAFQEKLLLRNEHLIDFFKELFFEKICFSDLLPLEKNLLNLNGNFACVVHGSNFVFAVVDRIRSIPLFYGLKNNQFYLSDDANWVRNQVCDNEMDKIAAEEFLLTGYVTGNETLFPNVKQMQAAECICVKRNDGIPQMTTHRYYRYIHENVFDTSEKDLYPVMDGMLINIFERLLDSTKRRTLVIPLSGGFDSRLIVAMLKKIGQENVICFSYGRPGNRESEISKQIAIKLGYAWEFVPYSHNSWHKWYQCEERKNFFKYGDGLCSLPIIQDWPAVWELRKKDKIPENAIIIPGHTGDFIAGNHIPHCFSAMKKVGREELVSSIIDKHYCLWDWTKQYKELAPTLRNRIYCLISEIPVDSSEDAANAFEYWEWQERQAKFIVNSIRAYEFWGYDWRIPLWDNEVMAFFSRVSFKMRLKKNLYDGYLMRRLFFSLEIAIGKGAIGGNALLEIKDVCRRLPLSSISLPAGRFLAQYYRKKTEYNSHPLSWYGIIPKKQFKALYTGHENINSFLTLERLGRTSIGIP